MSVTLSSVPGLDVPIYFVPGYLAWGASSPAVILRANARPLRLPGPARAFTTSTPPRRLSVAMPARPLTVRTPSRTYLVEAQVP